ncbi:MAG: serine--tRNA ligase, partial [bacterium]
MIDLRLLRRAPAEVRAALARRGDPAVLELLDAVRALDERRRALATELDHLK